MNRAGTGARSDWSKRDISREMAMSVCIKCGSYCAKEAPTLKDIGQICELIVGSSVPSDSDEYEDPGTIDCPRFKEALKDQR